MWYVTEWLMLEEVGITGVEVGGQDMKLLGLKQEWTLGSEQRYVEGFNMEQISKLA